MKIPLAMPLSVYHGGDVCELQLGVCEKRRCGLVPSLYNLVESLRVECGQDATDSNKAAAGWATCDTVERIVPLLSQLGSFILVLSLRNAESVVEESQFVHSILTP